MAILKSRRIPVMPDTTWPPTGRKESASVGDTSPNLKRQPVRQKPIASLSGVSQNSTNSSPVVLTVQKLENQTSGDCTATLSGDSLSAQPRKTNNASFNVAGWERLFAMPACLERDLASLARFTKRSVARRSTDQQ